MSYTSKQAAQESQRVESGANKVVSPKFADRRASTSVQLKQQQMMNASSVNPLQRAEDEELLQGKFETVQRAEEEELLQGKFETAQLVEEEELLQGKFVTTQLAEEEELLQGKFAPVQLASLEEEEPLQGKFETAQLAEEEELLQGKFCNTSAVQLEEKPNNTGLPNQLKAGIESLSGMSMDGVKVHYNSDRPAQLNAHAYAQGTDIHVAPGQEQHLPHEAWHVVQQAQGRVKPTTQMKGTSVNDDVSLETEADVMGAKALAQNTSVQLKANQIPSSGAINTHQFYAIRNVSASGQKHYTDGWGARYGITSDSALIASVDKSVRGSGEIDLGWYDAPESEQVKGDRRFEKQCLIGYKNGKQPETTLIYHCGPSGVKNYYD